MKIIKLILLFFIGFMTISFKCANTKDIVVKSKVVKVESDDDFIAKTFGLKNDRNPKANIKRYDISTIDLQCSINDPLAYATYVAWASEEAAVDASGVVVTTAEEIEAAVETKKIVETSYKFSDNQQKLKALNLMLNILLDSRPDSRRDLNYHIYLLDSAEVNAFTFGGDIFVSSGIINVCETVSELAFVIAHEIGHNEVKDINRILVRMKASGEFAELLMVAKQLTTISWNQYNEFRADDYGLNLVYAAGYDPCKVIDFWQKMSKELKENPDLFEKMFRTHPYSQDRANCARVHIKNVFGIDCD